MSHLNTNLSDEEGKWVNQLAGRLRLIRADAGAATAGQRREYFQEEIARAFKTVPAGDRERLLEALLARFPVAGNVARTAPVQVAAPKPAPESPKQTLERFLSAVGKLPPAERSELVRTLFDSPVAEEYRNALVLETAQPLQKTLGLAENEHLRLERLMELGVQLVEMLGSLDQAALVTLRQLSARNPLLNRPEDFRKAAAQFLTGGSSSMDLQIQAHSRLIGALLAAVLSAGKDFEREYLDRFSPDRIADVVEVEGGRSFLGPTKAERCWRKYEELSMDYVKPGFIDRRIKDCLGAAVERVARVGR